MINNGGFLLKQCAFLIKQNMSSILFSGWRSSHRHCLLHFSLIPSPRPSTLCWVSLATPQHRWGNLWIKPSHNAKHSYKKCLIIDWYGYLCTVPSHLIKCRSGAFLTVGSVPACLQLKSHSHRAVDEEYSRLLIDDYQSITSIWWSWRSITDLLNNVLSMIPFSQCKMQ